MSAATSLAPLPLRAEEEKRPLCIGLVTDLHYADKDPRGTRHYRQTLDKLAEAVDEFRRKKIDFVVELGDFIDAADSVVTEMKYLKTIQRPFAAIADERHYVLGNHCVDTLTKEEFLGEVEREKSYYSFDRGGFHFVVLDACFRSDGTPYGRKNFVWTDPNIPAAQLEWLRADLQETTRPTIILAHQRLDQEGDHAVNNAAQVRAIFRDRGNVLAVFQGHSHRNDYREIDGTHYCTLRAMVEGSGAEANGFSVLEIAPSGEMHLRGFRDQATRKL